MSDSSSAALTERAQLRLAEIRADISSRLWPVNAGMSSATFNELVDQMARLQLNFELRAAAINAGEIDTRAGPHDRRGFSSAGHADNRDATKKNTRG